MLEKLPPAQEAEFRERGRENVEEWLSLMEAMFEVEPTGTRPERLARLRAYFQTDGPSISQTTDNP